MFYNLKRIILPIFITSFSFAQMPDDCLVDLKQYLKKERGDSLGRAYVYDVVNGYKDSRYKGLGDMRRNIIGLHRYDSVLVNDPLILRVTYCLEMLGDHPSVFDTYQPFFSPSAVRENLGWIAQKAETSWGMLRTVTAIGLTDSEQAVFCDQAFPEKPVQCLNMFQVSVNDLALLDSTHNMALFEKTLSRLRHLRHDKLARILVQRYNDPLIRVDDRGDRTYLRESILRWFASCYTEEPWIRVGVNRYRYVEPPNKKEAFDYLNHYHQRFFLWAKQNFGVSPRNPYNPAEPWLNYSDHFGQF